MIFVVVKNFQLTLAGSRHGLIRTMFYFRESVFFALYMAGFIAFVLSLKKGFYRYQIMLFLWAHIVLGLLIAVSGFMGVIYNGLIWFLTSILLVATNYIFAYIFGKLFGKHKLIRVSPNETLEGFLGGLMGTVLIAWMVR